MMKKKELPFEIVISEDSARLSVDSSNEGKRRGYIVDAVMYIRHANECFPDDHWWDYLNWVIGMWENEVIEHIGRRTASYDLEFVDGGFKMSVKQNGNHLAIKGVNYQFIPLSVVFTMECTVQDMLYALQDAYKQYKRAVLFGDSFQREPDIQKELLQIINKSQNRLHQALLDLGE